MSILLLFVCSLVCFSDCLSVRLSICPSVSVYNLYLSDCLCTCMCLCCVQEEREDELMKEKRKLGKEVRNRDVPH